MVKSKKEIMLENAKIKLGEQFENALGYKVDIDTLTAIKAQITEQKFYKIKPSDYVPVVVGETAFSNQILTYKSFVTGGAFESGIIEPGSNEGRIPTADAKIEPVIIPTFNWAKEIRYNVLDLGHASKSGNWDLISEQERARKENWDLGIQQVAMLGMKGFPTIQGLLTQSDVTINTTVITEDISGMTATEFQALLAALLGAYSTNSASRELPDTFIIPTDDYLGLGTFVSESYPSKTRIEVLEDVARRLTKNPNFKILPLAYAQQEENSDFLGGGSGVDRYTLLRQDPRTVRMDIGIDYTTTIMDTINGFQYQSVAYGQFSGVKAYRPKEMLYFDHS